jgi:hypothetical protein
MAKNRRNRSSATLSRRPFTGPIKLSGPAMDDTIRTNVSLTISITSDSVNSYIANVSTSSLGSSPDWASFAAAYKECRVLGMKLRYEPFYDGGLPSTAVGGAGAMCVTHEVGAAVSTGLSQTFDRFGGRVWNISRPLTIEWRASDTGEWNFTNSTSAPDGGGFQLYISGLTPSFAYGRCYITGLVEFRFRN